MPTADEYRVLATEMLARARKEQSLLVQAEYEKLVVAYLRLADQAEKNAMTDIVYETPSERPSIQQQQQAQPKRST